MMTPKESAALRDLAARPTWWLDEVPVSVNLGLLRRLDQLGFILFQPWHVTPEGGPQPSGVGWVSPIRQPTQAGDWESIWERYRQRAEWHHPGQLRVSDAGRAEMDRLSELEAEPPPQPGVRQDDAKPLEAYELAADRIADAWHASMQFHLLCRTHESRADCRDAGAKTCTAIDIALAAMPSIPMNLRAIVTGRRAVEIEADARPFLLQIRSVAKSGGLAMPIEEPIAALGRLQHELRSGVFVPDEVPMAGGVPGGVEIKPLIQLTPVVLSPHLEGALKRLGNRPEHYPWGVDELPNAITKDALRQLDAIRLVEARFTTCWNVDEKATPYVTAWFSPLHDRSAWQQQVRGMVQVAEPHCVAATRIAGCAGWHEVLADRKRDEWHRPAEVRLTELGRATLATLRAGAVSKPDTPPTVAPGLLAHMQGLATAVADQVVERTAQALSTTKEAPKTRLPVVKAWAFEAWQASQLGVTVTEIAERLSQKYNDPKITQPRVSEQIKWAQKHAEASKLAALAAQVLPSVQAQAPARTLDPAVAEQGRRRDGRAAHLREKERDKARDNPDDER